MENQASPVTVLPDLSAHHQTSLSGKDQPGTCLSEALISLDNLRHNLACIREVTGPECRIMGIVKANAYGHGAAAVTATLEQEGVRDFGVANIHEAIELLQEHRMQPDSRILAFASPLEDHLELYLKHDVEMTICDHETLLLAEARAAALGKRLRVQVKVDTGMGRLGVSPEDASALCDAIDRSPDLEMAGIYTHFAESHKPDGFSARQLERFRQVSRDYENRTGRSILKHAANSGAIVSMPSARFDMVRPGILLYGCNPVDGEPCLLPVRPVMQFQCRVIFVKPVASGTTISYNRTWCTTAPARIATISAGYADGFHRTLSNRCHISIGGLRFPQVGTITMDQTMVNLGNNRSIKAGDTAVLFGWEGPSAGEQARAAGTISYELLCSVSRRVRRVFI
ncbi:MAG: alanine racemase [Chlorobiaceae bacterium]|nr:alanine racemase [Chlorobiaceae bacterium]